MRRQTVQMSFLETPPPAGAAPVWGTLDGQQRTEVVAALARVIAEAANAESADRRTGDEEKGDE